MRHTTLPSAATDLPPAHLTSPLGELAATFVPGAGMVATSLQHRGAELLGMRDGLQRYTEGPARRGTPLCLRWANRRGGTPVVCGGQPVDLAGSAIVSRDENGLPIHGL